MNKIEAYVGRIIEMSVLYNKHMNLTMSNPVTPKKVDVTLIPIFVNGKTKWMADVIEDGKLAGFTEVAFCKGMEEDFPEDHETALIWLKEFFDLDFGDKFAGPSRFREPIPDGYTMEDVLHLVAPVKVAA